MVHVQNFVCGAYASRKAAQAAIPFHQCKYSSPLRVRKVWHLGTFLYFVVF